MSEFLKKLSSYNIFNYLLPGIIFVILIEKLTTYSLILDNMLLGLFLYYFIGLVISRLGSLILEPLFKKISIVQFSTYHDFINASKQDNKIETLSEVNNMYRTFSALLVTVILILVYKSVVAVIPLLLFIQDYLLSVLLLIIFIFSYRKQSSYITKRINYYKDGSNSHE